MRVIAGVARRTALTAPEGQTTRPTGDRAKEGLFNIISPRLKQARFLDGFAGSGAIGIEALSRGAKEAIFIDESQKAAACISANLIKTRLQTGATMLKMPFRTAINSLPATPFDIIFLDPPYDENSLLLSESIAIIMKKNLLAHDGLLIAENKTDAGPPEIPPLSLTMTRKYGQAYFLFYENNIQINEDEV